MRVERGGVRRPDSFTESEEDRRRTVFDDHHRRAQEVGRLYPQVLLHLIAAGDEEGRHGR
ncbi:hypothetical protein D3C80_2093600 [compost metagenome]